MSNYLSDSWPFKRDIVNSIPDDKIEDFMPDFIQKLNAYASELQRETTWVYEQINLSNQKLHVSKGGKPYV